MEFLPRGEIMKQKIYDSDYLSFPEVAVEMRAWSTKVEHY